MKTQTKILLLAISAVILVTATVLGTIAYLTDRDEVVNTFTVGDVQIDLTEADVTPQGVPVQGADRVKDNDYHLIPGRTYVKDPTVTVLANSEESYVRMFVTIDNYTAIKAAFGAGFLPQNYVNGTWDNTVWVYEATTEDATADTVTYEFRYYKTVDTLNGADLDLEPLFTEFTLPGTVTGENLRNLANGFDISVVAHAVQAATFADADAAWAAFDNQNSNP